MVKKAGKLNLGGFWDAATEAYGEGREEWAKAYREGRKANNLTEDAARWDEMTGAYPTGIRARELFEDVTGIVRDPKKSQTNRQIRKDLGIGVKSGFGPRTGQLLGTAAADITQDNTRNFYWLLNAAQATGNVIAEKALGWANKNLYGKKTVESATDGLPFNVKGDNAAIDIQMAQAEGYLDRNEKPTKGVSIADDGTVQKRRYEPGHKAALMIPTGIAINTGLGLLTPFGGAEGYKAALPSEEDPTKTNNVLGEVAGKYFMGKTGQLLPYNDFKQVRPDVSPEEYRAYQAFKYDNRTDLNPLDGDFVAPFGIVKTTDEGIHGPELQFLGRSLPVTTGIVPYLGALAGGMAGVRTKMPIRGGVAGGMAGLAVGQIAGQLLENERRRRNAVENQLDQPQNI